MHPTTAFVYTDAYTRYDYGSAHPLRMERLALTYELIKAYRLIELPSSIFVETEAASEDAILLFHDKTYVDILKKLNSGEWMPNISGFGLGPGDNPIFKGLWDWSLLSTGASLECGKLVLNGKVNIAFNIAGGLHHALPARASGFCYINDPAVLIHYMLKKGKRVAYVDIDAHHSDGVQYAFEDTKQVLTISLHESGKTLFPGTGYATEIGQGEGVGYTVNIPLWPWTDDEVFLYAFEEVVPPLVRAFEPDVLVTQLGVDALRLDPLANMALSINVFLKAVSYFKDMGLPWIAVGGGGYNVINVARAWTAAWAIMNDVTLGDNLPPSFVDKIMKMGYKETRLTDEPFCSPENEKKRAMIEAEKAIRTVKELIFPIHGL